MFIVTDASDREFIPNVSILSNPASWLIDWFRGINRDDDYQTEKRLTAEACLHYAPVWYAVSRIAGHVGQLPNVVHKRMDRGADPAKDHAAYRLMKTRGLARPDRSTPASRSVLAEQSKPLIVPLRQVPMSSRRGRRT